MEVPIRWGLYPMTRMRSAAILALAFAARPQTATAQASREATVVFDRYMSPATGTTDLLTVQRELSSLEDRYLPLKFGDERRRVPLLASIGYRAGKFIFLDVPQDHMLLVLGHEVFGHGARLRELGVGRIGYSFDGPVPYGHGGAVTSFSGQVPDTPLTFLTIEMAGIEAQNVMADSIAERGLERGRLHYREAWLYFENRYLGMTYMLHATDHAAEGHDIADFVHTFEDACTEPQCARITLRDIKRGSALALADPMLYYALYGFASAYIANGKTTSPLPMIPIGHGMRFLPSVGFQLTPYGTERLLRSAFTSGGTGPDSRGQGPVARVTTVTLRVGHTGATTPWGIDAHVSDLRLFRSVRVGAAASLWRQPPVLADQTSALLGTGGAASATIALPLRRFTHADWLHAIVTAGYKSEGFVPGDQLGRGAILRVGLGVTSH
jgi:hypothetical protein